MTEENTALHHKVAQAKGSIVLGDRSADSTPDMVARPDSSKMRVRLDDSSQISKKHHMSALSADSHVLHKRRGLSPDAQNQAATPDDIDFSLESINAHMP